MMNLKAIVVGTGFAGKGHALALRYAGVEVVGMVGRTARILREVANELEIPEIDNDVGQILDRTDADIVSIGTPGGAHVDPTLAAIDRGVHVYCDKPLAADAATARRLYEAAEAGGVKTAFGASQMYNPSVLHLRNLIQRGELGKIQEIECISHGAINPLIPHGWSHVLAEGGGRLNNNFTHKLAIVLSLCPSRIRRVCGETRNDLKRAPDTGSTHDFRTREQRAPSPAHLDTVSWKDVDSDWSYTVALELEPSDPRLGDSCSVLFKHGGLRPRFAPDHIAAYGSEGSAVLEKVYGQGRCLLYRRDSSRWVESEISSEVRSRLPAIDDVAGRNWTAQMLEFVADIKGEPHQPYLTFREGRLFQEIIDLVRGSLPGGAFEYKREELGF